ncbi:MAG TPA: hypothetical protein VGM23_02605 [Armatimonadota bacterium]
MAYILAVVFAGNASALSAQYSQHAPVSICENSGGDDLDEVRLECVPPSFTCAAQPPVTASLPAITVLHLSPVIFQPPEAA